MLLLPGHKEKTTMDEGPGLFSLGDTPTQRTEVKSGANPVAAHHIPSTPSRITCCCSFREVRNSRGVPHMQSFGILGYSSPSQPPPTPTPYLLKGQQGVGLPIEVHTASEFLTDFSNLWRGGVGVSRE